MRFPALLHACSCHVACSLSDHARGRPSILGILHRQHPQSKYPPIIDQYQVADAPR
jgi:hypothetical protein